MIINIFKNYNESKSIHIINIYIGYIISDSKISARIIGLINKMEITVAIIMVTCYYYEKVWQSNKKEQKDIQNSRIISTKAYNSEKYDLYPKFNVFEENEYIYFVVIIILFAKFLEESVYSNSLWAHVSGIDLDVLNRYEQHILELLDYDLAVDKNILFNIETSINIAYKSAIYNRKRERKEPLLFRILKYNFFN